MLKCRCISKNRRLCFLFRGSALGPSVHPHPVRDRSMCSPQKTFRYVLRCLIIPALDFPHALQVAKKERVMATTPMS